MATYEEDSFFELPWQSTYPSKFSRDSPAMSPLQTVNGVGAVCRPGPVEEGYEKKLKKEAYLVGQPWENPAPLTVTLQSGLFNSKYF